MEQTNKKHPFIRKISLFFAIVTAGLDFLYTPTLHSLPGAVGAITLGATAGVTTYAGIQAANIISKKVFEIRPTLPGAIVFSSSAAAYSLAFILAIASNTLATMPVSKIAVKINPKVDLYLRAKSKKLASSLSTIRPGGLNLN